MSTTLQEVVSSEAHGPPSNFNLISMPLEYNRLNFLDLTNQMNNYNEIYNMNTYAENINNSQYDKIASLDATLKTQLYKLKQQYFLVDYSNHNLSFWKNILYFTLCMMCLTFIIIALFNSKFLTTMAKEPTSKLFGKLDMFFYIIISVISFIYLLDAIFCLVG